MSRGSGGVEPGDPPLPVPPPVSREVAAAMRAADIAIRRHSEAEHDLARWQREKVATMIRCREAGMTFTEIGELFGVTRGYVSNVVAGRR